ncbi:hypothetical protein CEXT_324281 [Caerostris extrusa]|uniref:Uncharacterized protein n=1 Tax=Caerostris extrusa TaxID=172846 RepID=A0AAV4NQE1_CAEEX|nr:hypothetical protein CEXT_324281 [Caerostris extrusa]
MTLEEAQRKAEEKRCGLRRRSREGFGEDRIACHPICAGHGMPYLILDHGLYDCLYETAAYPYHNRSWGK